MAEIFTAETADGDRFTAHAPDRDGDSYFKLADDEYGDRGFYLRSDDTRRLGYALVGDPQGAAMVVANEQLGEALVGARSAVTILAEALDRLGARFHRDLHIESSYTSPSGDPQLDDALIKFSALADECLEALDNPVVIAALTAARAQTATKED